jgi:hypothetical protein
VDAAQCEKRSPMAVAMSRGTYCTPHGLLMHHGGSHATICDHACCLVSVFDACFRPEQRRRWGWKYWRRCRFHVWGCGQRCPQFNRQSEQPAPDTQYSWDRRDYIRLRHGNLPGHARCESQTFGERSRRRSRCGKWQLVDPPAVRERHAANYTARALETRLIPATLRLR